MSQFSGRDRAALLVIDVQQDVVANAWKRGETIANIGAAVHRARAAGAPVVWIQHADDHLVEGSADWQIVPELVPLDGEPRLGKHYRSSFEETTLDALLESLDVGHLYLCGAQSDYCVRHTTHAAIERGYDVTLIEDAHTTCDAEWDGESGSTPAAKIIDEQNRSMHAYDLPGRQCRLATTAEVFAAAAA